MLSFPPFLKELKWLIKLSSFEVLWTSYYIGIIEWTLPCVPQNFYIETLHPPYEIIRRWFLWEVTGIRCGQNMNEISTLIRTMKEFMSLLCSPPCEDMRKNQQTATWKRTSPKLNHVSILILDFQTLELEIQIFNNSHSPWYFFFTASWAKILPQIIPFTCKPVVQIDVSF